MEKTQTTQPATSSEFVSLLQELQDLGDDLDISVTSKFRHGVIHLRGGVIVSANADVLHGHGAVLSLLATPSPEVTVTANSEPIRKTVSYSLEQFGKIIAAVKEPERFLTEDEEAKLLDEAKISFFLFQFKRASQCLATILKANRFYYPAWLWQSRIISTPKNISLALDEACRWGNSDQEVWREARRLRPQLENNGEKVQRCCFCWSVLKDRNRCDHCKSSLTIPEELPTEACLKDHIQYAVSLFDKAYRHDSRYAQTAYFLALGYFNLQQFEQSLKFMVEAENLSPRTKIYANGHGLLEKILASKAGVAGSKGVTSQSSFSGNSVLLVEDSHTSRKVLSMLLSKNGYEVLETASGKEAMEYCKSNSPDLVILDVVLPDTTGHKLLGEFRKIPALKTVPVVVLTATLSSNDKFLGTKYGVKDFVAKPFDPEKLMALVQGYLPIQQKKATGTSPSEKKPVKTTVPDRKEAKAPVVNKTVDGKKTVFVVEDSPTSRKVLKMILGRHDFNVVEAGTGKEALSVAESLHPDLVLLDLMLPDTTGYELFPLLKKNDGFKDIPFFILTGKRAPTDKMKGMLLGTNEYVTKPFNPEKLVSLIKRYL